LLCDSNFVVKRRFLIYLNQHLLALEFAEYWASQAAMPTIPILATKYRRVATPKGLRCFEIAAHINFSRSAVWRFCAFRTSLARLSHF
jgi:hypothetical protein